MGDVVISVVIPTRNPKLDCLREVIAALALQTFPRERMELCLVDNGSIPPLSSADFSSSNLNVRVVREECPGLLAARRCGIIHTTGPYIVFIDDDTVPAPEFVAASVAFMEDRPKIATAGGKILPRYLASTPPWLDEFAWLLALRDNGPTALEWSISSGTSLPNWTPIGAGLLVRRSAIVPSYLDHLKKNVAHIETLSWNGQGIGGVEDKDLVLHSLREGWSTGYTPDMILTHIIPERRLQFDYFEKLLPVVQIMWAQTLHAHHLESFEPIAPWTLSLRKVKSCLVYRAWRSPAHRLRWLQSCGYLEGLARNYRSRFRY